MSVVREFNPINTNKGRAAYWKTEDGLWKRIR